MILSTNDLNDKSDSDSTIFNFQEFDHLSYNCPNNILGEREPPPKKEKKKRKYEEPE